MEQCNNNDQIMNILIKMNEKREKASSNVNPSLNVSQLLSAPLIAANSLEPVSQELNRLILVLSNFQDNAKNNHKSDNQSQADFVNELSEFLKQTHTKSEENKKILLLIQLHRIDLQLLLSALNGIKQLINNTKKNYGQSLLTQAFKHQDFKAAHELLISGHVVGSEERAAFEVAIESRNAKDFGFPEKLTNPKNKSKPLHAVKKFGLFLGIKMTSEDGTSSQIARIEQTLNLLSNSIQQYAKNNLDNSNILLISEAFSFTETAAQYKNSHSQNKNAAQQLAERIQQGKPTIIPLNFKGHVMGCSVVPDNNGKGGYLSITNRGIPSLPQDHGTKIYRIDDLSTINPDFISTAMNGAAQSISSKAMQENINHVIGENAIPVAEIPQASQCIDNCTICNPRSNVEGMMLAMKAVEKGGIENISHEEYDQVHTEYKAFTHDMKLNQVKELVTQIRTDPDNKDYQNLAKNYIEQHPDAPAALTAPLMAVLEKTNELDSLPIATNRLV